MAIDSFTKNNFIVSKILCVKHRTQIIKLAQDQARTEKIPSPYDEEEAKALDILAHVVSSLALIICELLPLSKFVVYGTFTIFKNFKST